MKKFQISHPNWILLKFWKKWFALDFLEDGCPEGQIAFLEDGTEQPLLCSPDVSAVNLCPRGFTCINSPKLQRYQCCGVSAGCPSRTAAYISAITGQAQVCGPDNPNVCPPGFACAMTLIGDYVCCSVPYEEPGEPIGPPLQPVGPPLQSVGPPFQPAGPPFQPGGPPFQSVGPSFQSVGPPARPPQQTTAVTVPFPIPNTHWTPPGPTQAEPEIFRMQLCPDGTEPLLRARELHPCPCPDRYSCVMDKQICCLSKIPPCKHLSK